MKSVFFIIISLTFIVQSKLYNCQFGSLYNNRPPRFSTVLRSFQQSPIAKNNVRNLAVTVRNPIRITLNTNDFLTIKAGTDGASSTTTTKLDFIKRAMQVAERFYQLRLKVYPLTKILAPSMCNDYSPSNADRSVGISSSDLHIYVLYKTSATIAYGATGVSCSVVSGNTLPDPNFQQGRPNIGRIIFNTYTLVDQQASLTNRLFASVSATALHQTLHILGFDSSMYNTYLDSTGNIYGSTISNIQYNAQRSQTTLLTTPYVTAWAKAFFGCSNITGMQLEDQDGGAVGSHWERLVMYDQLMTGTALGAQKGISGLTFALIKDMGWYQVDDTFNDTSNYGFNKGCQLWQNGCNSSTTFSDYFCDPVAEALVTKCASNFMSKGRCYDASGANSNGFMSNKCSMYYPRLNCVDPNQLDDGYKAYTLETYSTSSFCVISTMGTVSIRSQYQSRCYPFYCISSNKSISFQINTYTILCDQLDAGNPKTSSGGLTGYLICPKYEDFCQQSRKICKNWCSKNGICTRGICNCLQGYSGQDCSKTICNSTQFYNPSSGTCVNACGSGTYENTYSRTCLACETKCSQCKGQAGICTSCPITDPPQVFYQTICIASCPSNTYQGGTTGDQCIDCNQASPYFCSSCVLSPQNCTGCSSADGTTRYLYPSDGTNNGTCVSACSGIYPYRDVVNFKCVAACQYNLISKPGNICDKCDLGTYKLISTSSCVNSCGDSFYQNSDLRLCEKCDSSCKTCDGQYSQNCTSCKPDSPLNLKYLLLKMCLTDCPRGFYPNDNTSSCQICPISKFCATCQINDPNVVCTSCKYGYFYQENKTCTIDCDIGMYKNTWNHTCQNCSSSCKTCTGPQPSSCTSCDALLFITNITGSYCIADCPTQGYYSDNVTCILCDKTCLTCASGTNYDCVLCAEGLYKSVGLCRYICPETYYPSLQTKNCESCDSNCTFCFGPSFNQCIYCIDGMYLQNTTCVNTCPDNDPPNKWKVCFCENLKIYFWVIAFFLIIYF